MEAHTTYPMRINKYLAHRGYATRKKADELIANGKVTLNGKVAILGDKVEEKDTVEITVPKRTFRYFAFNKPCGIITHSPQRGEKDIASIANIPGVFPIGRLDKDSSGLIILTDDGRITDRLLNPDRVHEKEYEVSVREPLPSYFKKRMESGIALGDYITKPCTVRILNSKTFLITLTEGKKHQIRRMCDAMHTTIENLKRVRIMNIVLSNIPEGTGRRIKGAELQIFLESLEL